MKRLALITTILAFSGSAFAQAAGMQSPAYAECSSLAGSNPQKALEKADAWLKIDTGIAAQHCRAMALYGLKRYAEAGDALSNVRDAITAPDISVRSYITRQASRAYLNANTPDKSLAILGNQITDIGNYRGDNANAAKLTSELLLDRARIQTSFGKLDEAAKDLDHAVSLTPVNETVLLERASVFEKLGDMPLAKADVDSVLSINPNNAQAKQARDRLNGKPPALSGIAVPPSVVAAPPPPPPPPPSSSSPSPVAEEAATPAPAPAPSRTGMKPTGPLMVPVNPAIQPDQKVEGDLHPPVGNPQRAGAIPDLAQPASPQDAEKAAPVMGVSSGYDVTSPMPSPFVEPKPTPPPAKKSVKKKTAKKAAPKPVTTSDTQAP